jgi:16S rRNA (adenine1518-N6/adenine1519-N6)-dimethyltransferase
MSDGLPPLREVIARHGLAARKSLGQNFLLDLNLTRRIARAAGPLAGHAVLEVGPGPGGLTRALLLEGADRVVAIERDPRSLPALHEIAAAYPGRLDVVVADALDQPWEGYLPAPARIVANLPYNIATPLLVAWLSLAAWPPWYASMTLMFQREVADRIVAVPGTRDYGRLSVLAQWRARPRKLFDIDPAAFVPRPKVVSSLVEITPCEPLLAECRTATLERVTFHAFGQRRKMLRSSLKGLSASSDELIAQVGLDPTLRAEQLPVIDFCRLAVALQRSSES